MRVLLLGPYPPPHGGVQTNLVDIRSFLLKRGVPCSVINITRHRNPPADEVYYPDNAYQLLWLLARLKYNVIHLHIGGMLTNRLLALCLACTLRPGTKSVLTFHSGGFPSTPEGRSLGPRSFTGLALHRFDALIGVNQELVAFFHRMGVPPNRTRLISPYAFVPKAQSAPSLPPQLAGFIASHSPLLISVGLLEPEYDLARQIEVLPQIRSQFPDAGLLLIGSGSLESSLRATIEANPCAPHILLAGDIAHAATLEAVSQSRLMLRTTLCQRFLQLAKPAIIEMERRLPDIQQELNDRGLSLRQALNASAEIAGPVLSKDYDRMRIKGYVNRLEKQFSEVIDVLLPPYEVLAGK